MTVESSVLEKLKRPFQEFIEQESFGGILLMASAVVALLWANSPWSAWYTELWGTRLYIALGEFALGKPLLLWINDGLMAVFFFVVGLEIKREILVGELSSPKQLSLPLIAALGGMTVPAVLYAAFNAGTPGSPGWGIPMATDIAFSLGVLSLLGKRIPLGLKVFVVGFAIIDDIGAVLVIAFFYTTSVSWMSLGVAAVVVALLVLLNRTGVQRASVYLALGLVLWVAVLKSGVHATIAGVVLAMIIPARARIKQDEFVSKGRTLLDTFEIDADGEPGMLASDRQKNALSELKSAREEVESPLQRLEHSLHPWVAFVIMPVFALANAGVRVGGDFVQVLGNPVSIGIIIGLLLGNQIGITLFSWLAVRTGIASLPAMCSWRHIYGVSWLAAIGFTMSLFIAGLAFSESSLVSSAKVGIMAGSLVAGVGGALILLRAGSSDPKKETV